MSTSSHSFQKLPQSPDVPGDVLAELLHSLSQPLTSLRCSLELSIGEVAEQQQEGVAVALQQTEKVIGMFQLMREYLDTGQPVPEAFSCALAPVTRNVIEELSSIAAVRGVQLRLVGTCSATISLPESRLRLALQYLVATVIEAQSVGGKVMLLLGEGPAGAVLRGEGEPSFREATFHEASGATTTLRRVKLAIASRVLENAGASLVFGNVGPAGFVLRIPRRVA
jgi:signal transduction histidine kinase